MITKRHILICFALAGIGLSATPAEAKKWRIYEDCVYEPNPANDGDSFHTRYNKRRYLFRLYFVDTPESDNSLPERVAEQAKYFGIDDATSIRVGKQAAKFTEDFLAHGFTAYSKLADARGRSEMDRDYAVINAGGKDLGTELVRNGLARIFGEGIDLPDGTPEQNVWWRLKTAENEAKQKKAGAWGMAAPVGRPGLPLPPPSLSVAKPAGAVNHPAPTSTTPGASPSSPASTPVPTPAPTGPIEEQHMTLDKGVAVFSTLNPNQQLGYLQAGARVHVLRAESDTMVRIRFTVSSNRVYEATCRRQDLGI